MTQPTGQHLQQIDPTYLLVDVNVRHEARVDADLVESVRALGVLQPIVGVRTSEERVRVRYGHRRTLAAVEAGLAFVPVLVVADERSDDDAQVERLVGQYAENEHRVGLSTAERIGVASQLAAFGVSPAQISKRTRMPRAEVDAALLVAASPLAAAATERCDFLDLTQAATVAEFEADPEAVTALVAAAKGGQFDHVAQRLRDARAEVERREALAESLRAAGVAVVERPEPGATAVRLDCLVGAEGHALTAEAHATCPGHGAYIASVWGYNEAGVLDEDDDLDEDGEEGGPPAGHQVWGQSLAPVYLCTGPGAYGHRTRYTSGAVTGAPKTKIADLPPEAAEAARAQRRDVIESNRAWTSAQVVRRDWLRTFLTRKSAPKGSAALVAGALARHADVVARIGANALAADLLGCEGTGYGRNRSVVALVGTASEPRAQVITLALVLAAYEDATHVGSWRSVDDGTRRHLQFLPANGYALSGVERRACGQDPLPAAPAEPQQ